MKYDPANSQHRSILANTLVAMLTNAGFEPTPMPRTKELVFTRATKADHIRVCVYTSIVDGRVRRVGFDAIRVVALYNTTDGGFRGLAKAEKRVNRTGNISDIAKRTIERMREVWALVPTTTRCRCGAPHFTSKAGNTVCADFCWKDAA